MRNSWRLAEVPTNVSLTDETGRTLNERASKPNQSMARLNHPLETRQTLILVLWAALISSVVVGSWLPATCSVMLAVGRVHISVKVLHFCAYLGVRMLLMSLNRPVRAAAAVSVVLESRLWLAEVLACLESKEGWELWLEVRHVLPSPPAAAVIRADDETARDMQPSEGRAWVEVLCRLVKALRCQAAQSRAEVDREFDEVMRALQSKLCEIGGPEEALEVAETAIMAAEQHNRQGAASVQRQLAEMDELLERVLASLGELAQQPSATAAVSWINTLVGSIHRIQALSRRLCPPEADRL